MSLENWGIIAGLIFGIWGAALSTYLAINEKRKDKRKLTVFLEFIHFSDTLQISIINTGFRPVTVINVTVASSTEVVPHGGLVSNPLPVVLEDGERVTIPFDRYFSQMWWENREDFFYKFLVYDAEGNEYEPIGVRYFNAKYGSYEGEGL